LFCAHKKLESRGILGPKKKNRRSGRSKLNNENFHNLYCSPNIVRMIKSRNIRRARDVVLVEGREIHKKIVVRETVRL
jgi:hypothetical protein